ncbi:FMN-binding protein [Amnibacterium sp.]|uniref:FMN-binding protein n=1 Tax=Amnibacterium sp. TaxID=1872496 RepID=UPI0026260A6B|nr:FMN-binding protein [Amnibacterium sp.]MCU1472874.1 FMN-binding protein [Amnibacterium sp.]
MRRAPIVLTATVLGTAGVLLFKPLPVSSLTGTSSASSDSSASSSSPDSTSSSSSAAASPSSSASASSSAGSGSSSTKAISTTATGALETDRYGNTQVKVTITKGRITEVTVLAYNDGDPRSAEISQQAIPLLRQEVLSKRTAAVDAVSGATYTSNAYEASLQSALDKAGYTSPDGSKANTDLSSADANLFGH